MVKNLALTSEISLKLSTLESSIGTILQLWPKYVVYVQHA